MILSAYSIFDVRTKNFMAPFFVQDFVTAKRHFSILRVDKKTVMGQYPQDYELYHVGEFDTVDGKFLFAEPSIVDVDSSFNPKFVEVE